ncbi:MAG: magnesium chelatase domain-containing protein, partial [Candidatus Bathyarchaeia archaeon]
MSTETRRIVHVKDVREENDRVRTLTFTDPLCASGQPGQYLMVWAPEVDEVPMSISNATERGEASVTVEAVGEATCALCRMKVGDRIGVMGPLGRGFTPHAGEVVMVAGGIGVIPLAFLAERLIHLSSRISFILGARTRERLVFTSRLESAFSGRDDRLIVTTEDGSLGRRGTAVDALHELLAKSRPDFLYACGPDVMLAKVFSCAGVGLDGVLVEVEVDAGSPHGQPGIVIVGLPDAAVQESRERVRAAIRNSGGRIPFGKVTINLAPADIKKAGPTYDLPIAIGILLASEQLSADLSDALIVGELSLDGVLRHTPGIIAMISHAAQKGMRRAFVPFDDAKEAALVGGLEIY